jgi:hypothetical protein
MWNNRSLGLTREACIPFIDYLGEQFSLLFPCGTTGQANYSCEGYVFAFILLVWDTCEQANTRKIQKSLLLKVAKKKKKVLIYMVNI